MCSRVPPAPVYKGARGEVAGQEEGAPRTGSRTPPFPCWSRRGKEGREEEKEKGGRRPLLVQFGLEGEGARGCPSCPSSSPTKTHEAQLTPRGVPVTPRYSGICPKPSGTFLVSEHSRPIYRSLRIDHFETPRHVGDHIRDSELPSVHQNTKTHNTDRH